MEVMAREDDGNKGEKRSRWREQDGKMREI